MDDILGVTKRLHKPFPPEPPQSKPAEPEKEGMIKVPKKNLKRAQVILKDLLPGKKVHMTTGATCDDVPFEVPEVKGGETNCDLCNQSFENTGFLHHHMKTHTGDTGWSCDRCGRILASRVMLDLHVKDCGQEKRPLVPGV